MNLKSFSKIFCNFVCKHFSTIVYVIFNFVCMTLCLLTSLDVLKIKVLLNMAIDSSMLQFGSTISLCVVTLLVTLEIAIKQLFIKSAKLNYFAHQDRMVWTFIFFIILFLCNCFIPSEKLRSFAYVSSVLFASSTLIIFVIDLINLNVSTLVKRKIKRSIKNIKKGVNPSEGFRTLKNLVVEATMTSDFKLFKEIMKNTIIVLKNLLENKYKLDCDKNNDKKYTTQILDELYSIHFLANKFAKDDLKENIIKNTIITKCNMLEDLLNYDNNEFIKFACHDLESYLCSLDDLNNEIPFFAYFFVSRNKSHIEKKISLLYEISQTIVFGKEICTISIFDGILKEYFKNKLITLNCDIYKAYFDNLRDVLSLTKVEAWYSSNLILDMWLLSPDEECKDVIKDFICMSKSGQYFVKPTHQNYEAFYRFILEGSKKDKNLYSIEFQKIHLQNTLTCINNLHSADELLFLPITKQDDFKELTEELGHVLYESVKNSKNTHPHRYFKIVNEFAEKLNSNDRQIQQMVIDLYKKVLLSLNDIESKDKITSTIFLFKNAIIDWDERKVVSEKLGNYIVESVFSLISSFISEMSLYTPEIYELTRLFSCIDKEECLTFISSDRNNFNVKCCGLAYNTGIQALEYGNDEIIKKSSNFIGWSLLDSLKTCSETCYRKIYLSYALALFRALVSYQYNVNTIHFVSTLFVVNYALCFGYREQEPQRRFASIQILSLNKVELQYIIDSIILRKNDSNYGIPNYSNNINLVTAALKKQLKYLEGNDNPSMKE